MNGGGALKFDKLRLTGFKSFVEETDVVIERGLTGVVGPNGCGKSNLVEALRWVMGEASYKSVRGTSMDDVIFAGSGKRPARDVAEVTLFLDNRARTAPASFNTADHLEVSRRITRALGSDYRVNGKVVRARDVQLLFADAATGSRSPSMVRQGQVAELIGAKPTERRHILEEAAGIAGLRARKHEATLKLNAAEANLSRVEDVSAEVTRQAETLKRQAKQARRYRALSDEIRTLEATVHHLKWREALDAKQAADAALTAAKATVADCAGTQARTAKDQAVAEHALPPLRGAEAEASAARQRLQNELSALDQKDRETADRLTALRATCANLAADLQRQDGIEDDARTAAAKLAEEDASLAFADARAPERLEALSQRAAEACGKAEAAEAEARAATERAAARQAAREAASSRMRRAEIALGKGRENRNRLQAAAPPDEDARLARRDKAASTLADAECEAYRRAEAVGRAAEILTAAKRTDADTQAELQRLEAAVRGRETEAAALTRLAQTLSGPGGVIDECDVAPGYEAALAAALGEDLNAPVATAGAVRWTPRSLPLDDAPLPDGTEPLSCHVVAPPALARRLAQVAVAHDGAAAEALQPGQRLVTREGALWRWDGYRREAGAPSAAAERLVQRNRLDALEGELAKMRPARDAARTEAEAARRTAHEAAAAEKAARSAEHAARKAVADARTSLAKAEADAKAAVAAAQERAAALATAEAGLAAAERENAEAAAELAKVPDTAADVTARDHAASRATAARAAAREAENALETERRAAAGRRKRRERLAEELAAWQKRLADADGHRAELAERLASAERERDGLAAAPSETAVERRRIAHLLTAAEAKARATADARAEGERTDRAAREAARSALEALSAAREAAARAEAVADAAEERVAAVSRDVAEALCVPPEAAYRLAGLDLSAPLPDRGAAEARLERMKAERERLGGVNLCAEDELADIEARRGTMLAERDDLVAAIEKLRQGIRELNREARGKLTASFEAVNAAFQRLFSHLFGGGEAELILTEADDPLDAGLDIVARPPGKKPQSLSLLSGGEQTLTATALIFAVFLTNPSPICVLDEIDAPLDDANVERFCNLLDEMTRSTDTRFLIITHNPITMAHMHRLYGVTMVERGVSQLVSVSLEMAEALRESA